MKKNFVVYLHICHGGRMKPKPTSSETAEASALAAELHIVLGALKRRLREHGDVADLTSAQKSVLLRLERDGPATGSALARAEAMRPQSMGAIIAVLESAGYVTGKPDPSDGRHHHFAHRSFPRLGEQGASGPAGLAASHLAGAADRAGTAPARRRPGTAQTPARFPVTTRLTYDRHYA